MKNSKGFPIYKFASLRSPDFIETATPTEGIAPESRVVTDLIEINESSAPQSDKLDSFNTELQNYIDSDRFIKTKKALKELKQGNTPASEEYVEQLYDNVIVRTLTKSTSNAIYKGIVEELKRAHAEVRGIEERLDIILPEGLVPTFTEFTAASKPPVVDDSTDRATIFNRVKQLSEAQNLLSEARNENVVKFESANAVQVINVENANILATLNEEQVSVAAAQSKVAEELVSIEARIGSRKSFNRSFESEGVTDSSANTEIKRSTVGMTELKTKFEGIQKHLDDLSAKRVLNLTASDKKVTTKYAPLLLTLKVESIELEAAENALKSEMKKASKSLKKLAKKEQYSYVGEKWVNTTALAMYEAQLEESYQTLEHSSNCELKYPFQIADLRVVEQEPVGYLPGEIAHINNTQPGEVNTRVTRRLKKIESTESLFNEREAFRETDTQSTDKFSLEKSASEVQEKKNSLTVNASASAKFGAYSASLSAGYATSNSSTSSNAVSQNEAREVVESIVERVSDIVRSERSTKTVEEFEETVTHLIDNSGAGTKSYVYRWLNKLVRATLKNYGKRLIFQFDIAHPAHYYLSRAIKDLPTITLPEDPRKIDVNGEPVLTVDSITRDNYLAWAAMYKTELEQPPAEKVIVSEVITGDDNAITEKKITIKPDYQCQKARISTYVTNGWPFHNYMVFMIGNRGYGNWSGDSHLWSPLNLWLDGETEQLPVSLLTGKQGHAMNIEVECILTDQAYQAWKIKTYNSIVAAYESLKSDADAQLSAFDPNLPGLNPAKKDQLIRAEIKKETIRKMFRCNPFWVNDDFVVGQEYDPDCCKDSSYAEKVRFLESTFDWDNMTYELHPYFYSNKASWSKLLDLADNDPHFEAFLQASFATIQVPVHRDHLKEVAAINFVKYNSLFNYEVIPEEMEDILDELDAVTPTLFTYDLEGNELPEPAEEVDLGIFNLPTSLVILECGTSDGVKPIGFPQSTDEPTSDVEIPKQYSPAIIADSCAPA